MQNIALVAFLANGIQPHAITEFGVLVFFLALHLASSVIVIKISY